MNQIFNNYLAGKTNATSAPIPAAGVRVSSLRQPSDHTPLGYEGSVGEGEYLTDYATTWVDPPVDAQHVKCLFEGG